MAILHTIADPEEWTTFNLMTVTAGGLRGGYARCAIHSSTISAYAHYSFGTTYNNGWITARTYKLDWTQAYRFIGITDGQINYPRLALVGGASSYVRLVKYDGVTQTELAVGGTGVPTSQVLKWDIQWANLNTASATINVYLSGVLYLTYTGDLSAILSHADGLWVGTSTATAYPAYFSEIIVADESTLRMSLVTLVPNGAGASTFDGGAYTDIDEYLEDQSDCIYSSVADQEFSCNVTAIPAGTYAVRQVEVLARASKGSSGPSNLKLGVEEGSTTDLATEHPLSTGMDSYSDLWSENPDTSLPWTTDEINGMLFHLKSIT